MGNCGTKEEADVEKSQKNRNIEKRLRDDKQHLDRTIQILLLGAGESGKSTFFKQMRILYMNGISKNEVAVYRNIIFSNIILAMRTLTLASAKLGFELKPENVEKSNFFREPLVPGAKLSLDGKLASDVAALWKDPAIQSTLAESHRFQLADSTQYLMDNLDRIAQDDYVPSTQDILFSRSKTVGICEVCFDVEDAHFKMVDVGGQRSERTKWIYCFENVNSIIFFAALSEYNLTLFEDPSVNRMHESLKLFDEIVNAKWFKSTPIILFLNKSDLFKKKIKTFPLSHTFPDYDGPDEFDAACKFVKGKFLCLNESANDKRTYVHVTCCTDTENIKFVFDSVRDVLMKDLLKSMNLIN